MDKKRAIKQSFEAVHEQLRELESLVLDEPAPLKTPPIYHLLPIDYEGEIDPDADGVSIRFSWDKFTPRVKYNWPYLEKMIGKAKAAGKPFMLRMMAGKRSPRWAWENWVTVQDGDDVFDVPLPTETHIKALVKTVGRLAEEYPEATAIHCAGWYKSSEATKVPHPEFTYPTEYYTRQADQIAYYGGQPVFNVAPPGGKPWIGELIDYANANGVVVQSNALGAQLRPELPWVRQVINADLSGWQALCPVGNQDRFNPTGYIERGVPFAAEVGEEADPLWYEWYSPRKNGDIDELRQELLTLATPRT